MRVFKLPDLGEGLQEAEISEWHVAVGDEVAIDQPLLAVETAKAIVEIPSPWAGKVRRLFGKDWLDARHYDLAIDSGRIGVARTADIIERAVNGVSDPAD